MGKSLPNSSKIIDTFTNQFQVGIPKTLYTDGATMFTSAEFKEFAKAWNITHKTSSPHYHQSNGIAEEAVKEAKKMIRPNLSPKGINNQGLTAALLGYHNTPKRNQTLTPSQKVFGKYIKDTLPSTQEHMNKLWDRANTDQEKAARKNTDTQPRYRWENFKIGDRVYIQSPNTKEWDLTGTIIQQGNNIHEWLVKTDANAIYRRNHHYLRAEEKKAWLEGSAPLTWNKPTPATHETLNPSKPQAPGSSANTKSRPTATPAPRSILKREIRLPARYVQSAEREVKIRFAQPGKDDMSRHENTRDAPHPYTLRRASVFNPDAEWHLKVAQQGAARLANDVLNHGAKHYNEFWYQMRGNRWYNPRVHGPVQK